LVSSFDRKVGWPMGPVTEYVTNLITRAVDDSSVVVWFDPEKHYSSMVKSLDLPGIELRRYAGSYFALRHDLDSLLERDQAPRLVVYVPVAEEDSNNALVELTAIGAVVKPGQSPWQRNTRLSVVARNALKPHLPADAVATIERQVDAGQLTLDELDKLVDGGAGRGVVAILFDTGDPIAVALAYLNSDGSDDLDTRISKRDALPALTSLLEEALGIPSSEGVDCESYRRSLAQYVLVSGFAEELKVDLPENLETVSHAKTEAHRRACLKVASEWQLRTDMRDSFVRWSDFVDAQLALQSLDLPMETLLRSDMFRTCEQLLQSKVESSLLSGKAAPRELARVAKDRRSGFWSAVSPDIQARWSMIEICARLLAEADRIEKALESGRLSAHELVKAYALDSEAGSTDKHIHEHDDGEGRAGDEAPEPWCVLDTLHRRLERRRYSMDVLPGERLDQLERLIALSRRRYTEVCGDLAQSFVQALERSRYRLPGVLRQVEVYREHVEQYLADEKVAYVLVDALRYEMARELVRGLDPSLHCELLPAIASVPTITAVGMAALMPGADSGLELKASNKNDLEVSIGGRSIGDRASRVRLLSESARVPFAELKLDDVSGVPRRSVRNQIESAQLVLVTSQEIDQLCESDNVGLARRIMDDIVAQIQRACRVLVGLGADLVIVAADHGYLFGEEISGDMKVDPPGGTTVELHRRVWIGRGGSSSPMSMRARLSDFGLDSELEIASPVGCGAFKVKGGARAYFHGGLSLQELVIPVIKIRPRGITEPSAHGEIKWELVAGSRKLSTRFFSVQIRGRAESLLAIDPPRVRVEIREGTQILSVPVSALYGFEEATGTVNLRTADGEAKAIDPNTVAMHIAKEPVTDSVTVHLLDAATGRELSRLGPIEVSISI
jgi:hypothetical protein